MGETAYPEPARGIVTVLGEVTVDGEVLTGRQQAIVSAIVMYGSAGASTEQLIDCVWPLGAPSAARASLQNQVTRLRRRFGPEVISTGVDGYRIGRDSDVAEFERLAAAGLRRPAAGAVPTLESALGRWGGTPYAVLVDHPCSDSERTRLLALRAEAAEHLCRGLIELGDHQRAIRDLICLVEEDPWREQRWELLMRAQYGAGLRTDALATYRRFERWLSAELEARPSGPLVELRGRIDEGEPLEERPECSHRTQRGYGACGSSSRRHRRPGSPS